MNKSLFVGGPPMNKSLLVGGPLMNNSLFAGKTRRMIPYSLKVHPQIDFIPSRACVINLADVTPCIIQKEFHTL